LYLGNQSRIALTSYELFSNTYLPACSISKTPSLIKSGSLHPVNLPLFVHSLSPHLSRINDPGFFAEEDPTLDNRDDDVREMSLNGFPVEYHVDS
jgi:hypothetical protein